MCTSVYTCTHTYTHTYIHVIIVACGGVCVSRSNVRGRRGHVVVYRYIESVVWCGVVLVGGVGRRLGRKELVEVLLFCMCKLIFKYFDCFKNTYDWHVNRRELDNDFPVFWRCFNWLTLTDLWLLSFFLCGMNGKNIKIMSDNKKKPSTTLIFANLFCYYLQQPSFSLSLWHYKFHCFETNLHSHSFAYSDCWLHQFLSQTRTQQQPLNNNHWKTTCRWNYI